jgi:chaperonin cofactor prefoldin
MNNNATFRQRDEQFTTCLTKAIASLLTAVPASRWRSVLLSALRMCNEAFSSDSEVSKRGSSVVFPVLAIPDDATLPAAVDLISGMGAVILAAGQAKPSTTVREMMDIADTMMGRSSSAFSGDPEGIGMPIVSAISAAASADPAIIAEADRMGLGKMIADLSRSYDCLHHEGPLSMVHVPSPGQKLLAGGLKDFITGLFDSPEEKATRKADNKVNKLEDRQDALSEKVSDLELQLKDLEAQLAVTTDSKAARRLQKKIERIKKKISRKERKQDKVTDKLNDWKDLADNLHDRGSVNDVIDNDEGEEGRRRRGEEALVSDMAEVMTLQAEKLANLGLSQSLAGVLVGYLVPQGVSDPVAYVTKVSSTTGLDFKQAAQYIIYVASGFANSDAMRIVKGESSAPSDISDFLEDARAKNDAYRIALQDQMTRLRNVNEAAASATRLFTRSEWADAIMSSSDEVADWLQMVSPDASNTASMMSSIVSLLAAARSSSDSPGLRKGLDEALAKGLIDANAAYMLTGDPSYVPLLAVISPGSPVAVPSSETNPVWEAFSRNWE